MSVLTIDHDNFEHDVLGSDRPFLLDFSAPWCRPCARILPALEKIAADGDVRVGKLDVDQAPEIAARLRVKGTPTLVLFDGGRELRRWRGVASEARIRRFLAG